MIKRILTLFSVVALLGVFFIPSGCVKEDFDTTPPLENVATWNKTITIAQLKTLYIDKAGIVSKLANDESWNAILAQGAVIEGYVISSDSAKNFYETVTIMDETGGVELKINDSELYLAYGLKPGQKVMVRTNDLALDNYNGVYQLGFATTDIDEHLNIISVDKIAPNNLNKFLQLSGSRQSLEPLKIKLSEITDEHISKLVTIDSVQFWNPYATYAVDGETTNRILVDKHGNQIALRNSGFAKFKNVMLPTGSGSITGVLSTYGTTRQFYIRDLNDIKFADPRFDSNVPVPNKTIAELKALCTADSVEITQDIFIDGVVVANDEYGNIYQKINIQDETGAIEFKVFSSMLYSDFSIGTKVVVNCKGLHVGKYGKVVQLGGMYYNKDKSKWEFGGLSSDKFYPRIFLDGQGIPYPPIETSILELNDAMIGKVIKLNNVQFSDLSIGGTYAEGSSSATNRYLVSSGVYDVIVRNSRYASFATVPLPTGSGSVTAVLGKYFDDYQLYIQSLSGVELNAPRFTINPNKTILDLKALYTSGTIQINDDYIVEGVVVGNDISGNLYKQLFISDESAGIEFRVNVTKLYLNYPVGTKVLINCKGMYLGSYGGVTQLGGLYNGSFGMLEAVEFNAKVVVVGSQNLIPIETTIADIDDSMLGKLVKLNGVQFIDSELGKVYAESAFSYTNRTLEDASNSTIIVRTSKYAGFASTVLPNNSGAMTAILSKYNSTYQLYIREIGDVNFNQERLP